MTKAKVILIFLTILGTVSLLTYLNYDRILNYFTNREWEIAGSIGNVKLENYLDTCCTNSNFIVAYNNFVEGYSKDVKKSFEESLQFKNVLLSTAADYAIIAEKDSSLASVIYEDEIIWSTDIKNASILGAHINKNGYAAIIYSQVGYKSLIKVFSNTGEELFTNYLASTYAIDVAISNDNKVLAIAEVDTNGINVKSNIKLIDVQTVSESTVKKYELDDNELITDLEFNEDNDLVIMTDFAVKIFKNGSISTIVSFKEDNVAMVDISDKKNVVAIKTENDGLFNSNVLVSIYNFKDLEDVKTYELEEVPVRIAALKNIIAIDTGSEIIFINSFGNFVKKCEYKGQLKNINLMEDGDVAVLIFRDSAEFIKVGGI